MEVEKNFQEHRNKKWVILFQQYPSKIIWKIVVKEAQDKQNNLANSLNFFGTPKAGKVWLKMLNQEKQAIKLKPKVSNSN